MQIALILGQEALPVIPGPHGMPASYPAGVPEGLLVSTGIARRTGARLASHPLHERRLRAAILLPVRPGQVSRIRTPDIANVTDRSERC